MTYELIQDVFINDVKYKIVDCSITKNISSFTNTATIKVPKRLTLNNEDIFSDVDSFIIKKGDKVSIKLGYRAGILEYFDNIQFAGFVSDIKMGEYTVDILVEDYMYFLKKTKFNFSVKSISLYELANKLITELNKISPDKLSVDNNGIGLTITDLKLENCTGVDILNHLKENYTLDSFFIDKKLSIGINYNSIATRSDTTTYTFSMFNRELIKTVSDKSFLFIIDKSSLSYQKIEDVKFKITVKIFVSNDKVITKNYGDEDGNEVTFIMKGNPSQKEVDDFVANQLLRIKYEGFKKGSTFSTFGKSTVNPLDIVTFDGIGLVRWYSTTSSNTSKINLYKKSSYLVNAVTTTFNNSGFRQVIEISNRLSLDEGDSISDMLGKTIDL